MHISILIQENIEGKLTKNGKKKCHNPLVASIMKRNMLDPMYQKCCKKPLMKYLMYNEIFR